MERDTRPPIEKYYDILFAETLYGTPKYIADQKAKEMSGYPKGESMRITDRDVLKTLTRNAATFNDLLYDGEVPEIWKPGLQQDRSQAIEAIIKLLTSEPSIVIKENHCGEQ